MLTNVAKPALEICHVSEVPLISFPVPLEVICSAAPVPELVTVNTSFVACTPARVHVVLSICIVLSASYKSSHVGVEPPPPVPIVTEVP